MSQKHRSLANSIRISKNLIDQATSLSALGNAFEKRPPQFSNQGSDDSDSDDDVSELELQMLQQKLKDLEAEVAQKQDFWYECQNRSELAKRSMRESSPRVPQIGLFCTCRYYTNQS